MGAKKTGKNVMCKKLERKTVNTMNTRSLKQMLKEQELIVGLSVVHVCTPWLAKMYADAGSDYVYLENEHTFFNEEKLANFIFDCRLCGMPVVAKSTYLNRGNIAKLLDAGVTGIQLPMTETAGQMQEAASYIKFPPEGIRAAGQGLGNTDYEPVDEAEWVKKTNSETVLIAHVESRKGLSNIV
ncbi:MAG: hypothetical protein FIA99_07935, partial [Ruminiclostridium sp.]|nr:hypothetical protein [Ruminiclostridium sp.]